MGRSLERLRLPNDFWSRPDVGEALVARDVGGLFRLVAKWAGASQTQIAIAVGMTQGQVSGIMAGRRQVVAIDVAERVLNGVGAPGSARVAFGLAARSSGAVRPDEPAPASAVDRREVLRLGGALAIDTVVAPASRLSSAILSPRTDDTDAERPSLTDLTRRVQRAWQLRQRADYEALAQLVPGLVEQTETGVSTLDGAEREQATRLSTHTYNAASSLLRRLGDGPLALLAADRAVRTARTVGDPILVAAAMYRLANVLMTAGRAQDTKTVALRAAGLVEPGQAQAPRGLAMWGGLVLTAAVAAARCAEEAQAWELLGEARTGGRLLGREHADIFSIFGPTNVAIHGVQVAIELGRGADAVRRSNHVNPDRLPASLAERRGQYLIDVAHGHVLERSDADAVVTLQRAEGVAPQEVRLSGQVRELTRTMLERERSGAAPGLRELAIRVGVVE